MFLKNTLLLLLHVISISVFSENTFIDPASIYRMVSDIYHPTLADYQMLEKYLMSTTNGGIMKPLGDEYVDRNFINLKILGNGKAAFESGLIAVNCDFSERENCLITYGTFNQNFANNTKRLVNHTMNSDFKGHVLFHVGGWPNTEEGDLILTHVPYAFKVASFREAKRLGFKRVFWLDSAAIPMISLNDIFNEIEQYGYYSMGNCTMVGPYANDQSAHYFGLTLEETYHIPSCSAGMFGVDFTTEIGCSLIDQWYVAALDPDAFFSPRSDQTVLSLILYTMGLECTVSHDQMLKIFQWVR